MTPRRTTYEVWPWDRIHRYPPRRRAGEDSHMFHASALACGWRSALRALIEAHNAPCLKNPLHDGEALTDGSDRGDDEREPFHLDDTELASRLVRDRGLVHYSTPPHTHMVFPSLPAR